VISEKYLKELSGRYCMSERKLDEWKNILKSFKRKKISVKVNFKFPQFEGFTIRTGKIISIEDNSFGLDDYKIGLSYYSYDYVVSVEGVQNEI
jgi:hypothetical protein